MNPKVLLQNQTLGGYFAGRNLWTSNRLAATHFKSAHQAVRSNKEHSLRATHLVFAYERPNCLVTVPIAPDLTAINPWQPAPFQNEPPAKIPAAPPGK